jgi:aspartate/methionine/tyrosine aminotransferase
MFGNRTARDVTKNALAAALERERARGRRIVDLTQSNPTVAGIPYDEERILSALRNPKNLVYAAEPFGLASARAAVAAELASRGTPVDPVRIALTASTSEAYAFLLKVLADPGDCVLVPQPSYPLFELLASFEGVRLVSYRLAYDGRWHIDLDSLKRAAKSPGARAVFLVSPNNPTGSYVTRAELGAIASLGLPIVSDEVFASYVLEPSKGRAESALEADGALVFALGGLSKLAALPQMKLAWIAMVGPAESVATASARLELVADSFLSVGTPVQHALPVLLASRGVAERAILSRIGANLTAARRAIRDGSPASVLHVEGGWYAIIRVPRTRSEEAWTLLLLDRFGVYVHPGAFFGFDSEAYLIVSLLAPEEDFNEGLLRIARLAEESAVDA